MPISGEQVHAFAKVIECSRKKVTAQLIGGKTDWIAERAGPRRYARIGNDMERDVIPAKAGIQCWRTAIHRMC
jgi:hypothetical protein